MTIMYGSMIKPPRMFVDEQLEQVQSAQNEFRCCFADHKTMQIRTATTHDLSDKSRICLLDFRDAPNCEFEAIHQRVRNVKLYMLTAQYNDDSSNDDSICVVNRKQMRDAISCSICAFVQRNKIRLGTPVWVLAPICLDSSDRLLKLERIFTSIPRNEMRKLQWNPPSHDSSGLDRRDGGTVLSSTWSMPSTGKPGKSGPQES